MNCCSDEETGSKTFAQMLKQVTDFFRSLELPDSDQWSESLVTVLFAVHVVVVVAFVVSHCRPS